MLPQKILESLGLKLNIEQTERPLTFEERMAYICMPERLFHMMRPGVVVKK